MTQVLRLSRAQRERFERTFWSYVQQDGACWVWTGAVDRDGYGRPQVGSLGKARAHRVAYELLVAPIPAGLQLDHLCRNRLCVNALEHLDPVTARVNTLRSTAIPSSNAAKTHCKYGHEFTDENTRLEPGRNGRHRRVCRQCGRRKNALAWARSKGRAA